MDIDLIRRQMKLRRANINTPSKPPIIKNRPFLVLLITRIMLLSIIFLLALIFAKSSSKNKEILYNAVFRENISFAVINNLYNRYLGGILPFKDLVKDNESVFKEKLTYKEANIYKDGVALSVDNKYLVPAIDSGIVIFTGEKEDYGKTVIIEQANGVNVWYANVDNLNVKIYDYIEGGSLIGETINNKLYLVFEKEGKKLDYKEYIE
jgi:stage IV sporulation protein FA